MFKRIIKSYAYSSLDYGYELQFWIKVILTLMCRDSLIAGKLLRAIEKEMNNYLKCAIIDEVT